MRERAAASEPRERSAPAKRRARERVGESEGRSPSDNFAAPGAHHAGGARGGGGAGRGGVVGGGGGRPPWDNFAARMTELAVCPGRVRAAIARQTGKTGGH